MPTQTSTMVGVVQAIRFLQLFGVKPLVPHSFCRVQAAWAPITGPPPHTTTGRTSSFSKIAIADVSDEAFEWRAVFGSVRGTDLKTPRRSEGAGAASVGVGTGP